jgi:hypothetical protein
LALLDRSPKLKRGAKRTADEKGALDAEHKTVKPPEWLSLLHDREAYARACAQFLAWSENHVDDIRLITPVHVAAYMGVWGALRNFLRSQRQTNPLSVRVTSLR